MKIAIITSGILPVPAVLGGAVENLIDFYLEYNQEHQLHDITIYSIANENIKNPNTPYNHYHYIDTISLKSKLKRKIFQQYHSTLYYHYHIEYFLSQTLKHLKKEKYDVIILENRPGYAIPVSQASNAKIILHLHNDLLNPQTPYARNIHECCTSIISISNYIKQCVDNIGLPSKTRTVYNGIDIKRFQHPNITITRDNLGFSYDDFIVVYSGRINQEKGVYELVQAFINLKKNISIKLLVLGGEFYGNQVKRNNFIDILNQEIKKNSLPVKLTGFISYEEIPAYLAIADIAVVPSLWEEPFALTCIEAMASGLPLIATRSGGIPEICQNYAILLDKENIIDNLTCNIDSLFHNQELRNRMIISGLKYCTQFDKMKYSSHFFKSIQDSI